MYTDKLKILDFPNYNVFNNIDSAFSNFTSLVLGVIDEVAPLKKFRVKNNTEEWFDGEILEKMYARDRLLKKI